MFFFQTTSSKIDWLFSEASKDAYLKSIISDLEQFGFDIRFPLYGGPGEYQPKALESNSTINEEFLQTFKGQLDQGEHKAQFKLSPRFGKAQCLHTFIHELFHFHQDMLGLMLTPFEQGQIIQPDLKSHIEITLLCEAIAATEAMRASWRLKNLGASDAWNGAFLSFNWHGLAKGYIKDIRMDVPEEEAAKNCFEAWYKSSHRRYFEKRAFETYKNHNQDYRSVDLNELVERIPNKPDYLKSITSDFELDYKSTDNKKWQDIIIGSPVYIWAQNIKT